MSRSKEYKAIKNYIHNELGLSKEDIREMIVPEIKEQVMRCFRNTYGSDTDVEGWIRHKQKKALKAIIMDERDYVSFKTALELKKAGFNYQCQYYYTKEDAPDGSVWCSTSKDAPLNYNNIIYAECSMPSLWQAQKMASGSEKSRRACMELRLRLRVGNIKGR